MILFACQCGTPYSVEDQYAGGSLECTSCGKPNQIPTASDPRVVLIFKAGESEDGMPMLREEVERLVTAGQFTEAELIWDGTTWRPVTDVVLGGQAKAEEKPKLHLKRREDEVEEEEEGDLSLGEIEPIQKVQLDEIDLQQLPTKKRDKKVKKEKAKKEKKEKREKAPSEPGKAGKVSQLLRRVFGSDPSLGRKVNVPIQIFWVLVVGWYGFKLGLGPLLSKFREKPSYVVVYNFEQQECTATLGWRRLKKDVYPGTASCFELYVGMREKQKVTLTSRTSGQAMGSVTVPVWPGGLTVVNVGGKGGFAQVRSGATGGENLPGGDVKQLADQIGGHQEPSAILKLAPEGRRIAKKALVNTRRDPFFTSAEFRFERNIVQGDTEMVTKFFEALDKRQKESKKAYDLIAWPPLCNANFHGGSAVYDLRNDQRTQMVIWLPRKTFQVGKSLTVTLKDNPKLEVSDADGTLRLKIEIQNYQSKFGSTDYTGTWRYGASQTNGRWDWAWSFEGQNDKAPNGRKRVYYRYDRNYKESGPTYK